MEYTCRVECIHYIICEIGARTIEFVGTIVVVIRFRVGWRRGRQRNNNKKNNKNISEIELRPSEVYIVCVGL